ncbi:hypothetical protein N7474_001846 [Penicillium riverlandense]|uniref:uncharacterized protein n=1 Tax=Penicillium riverlandense TaxID=1903569 RepID=UPI002546D743|nr:uncharacterized protein N7474_001846 [Penicillium riverlandense]KAJ5833535.1 hypothetical protein N7474_001846 [Penicillium riverlandense]
MCLELKLNRQVFVPDTQTLLLTVTIDGAQDLPITAEDLETIRSWLCPTEYDSEGSEYQKHLNSHAPGTGDWLFQTDKYRNWHDSGLGALWVQGIPGSGKSVAAANLIQTLKKEDVPVLFFFARRIIKSNSNPRQLAQDCLSQLLDYSIPLQATLKKLHLQHSAIESAPFHELWRSLLFALSTLPMVYLVFDALDELDTEQCNLLQCIYEIGKQKPESIKLIMTSRPIPSLQNALRGPHIVRIRLEGGDVESDIATYLSHRLANEQRSGLTLEDCSLVKEVLCQKAAGLFLYARLMLDEIIHKPLAVREHLEHLPGSLEDMYVNLLHEHSVRSGASRSFQFWLLSCITHASRPLRATELAALINSRRDRSGLNASQDAKLMARTSCGPLLEILDNETVQVIHHSFTEFLLDRERKSAVEPPHSDKWFPALSPIPIHQDLAISSIDYLLSGCFDSWSVSDRGENLEYCYDHSTERNLMIQFPFLKYASQNLLYHAAKCRIMTKELMLKLDGLCQYGAHDFESWKDFLLVHKAEGIPDNFRALHMAGKAGLEGYIVHLIERGEQVDAVDSYGRTASAYAAMNGHAGTLANLVASAPCLTISDKDGLLPVHHAAKGNHVKALQCLLDIGADPMSPKHREDHDHFHLQDSTIGKTPIQYACELGAADVVSELLTRMDSCSRSTILPHYASATGQSKTLEILLRYPEIVANINKHNDKGKTALFLAAVVADSETVRILLSHGADVHAKSHETKYARDGPGFQFSSDKPELNPLQGWARITLSGRESRPDNTLEEWKKSATYLIEAGADVNSRHRSSPILFAWVDQYFLGVDRADEFVSLLLRHGANACATDSDGNTVLHQNFRMSKGRFQAIKMLTVAGADINEARPSDGATPLILAARAQCTDVSMYINNGADPNLQDHKGNTALHYICTSWLFEYEDIQKWLKFADPTIKNKKGALCLYNLRYGNGGDGRVNSIPLFMDKGLDLESRDRLGRTALLAACNNGESEFITGLIKNGANAKARDFQNKSALHIAAQVKFWSADAQALIQAGCDINCVDFEGNTPFHDAIRPSVFPVTLKTILELGGLANLTTNRGETALHKLVRLPNVDPDSESIRIIPAVIDFLLQPHLGINLHAADNEGIVAIHCAASTSEAYVWKLYRAGADINVLTNDDRTPLHFAAGAGHSSAVSLLCKLYCEKSYSVDQKDENGRTPLHHAALSGNLESVYSILQAGANPNIADKHGLTPLHLAAEHQVNTSAFRKNRKYRKRPTWGGCVRSLAAYIIPPPNTRQDRVEWDLSFVICQEEEARMTQDVVRCLLAAGADPAICDNRGQTAYDVAVFIGHEEVVDALLSSPNLGTKNSLMHRWCSTRSTHAESIARGIEDNNTDAYATLQAAISTRNEAVVKALLDTGLDPMSYGPEGLTPVHYVSHWGLMSMMKTVAPFIKDINAFSPPLLHVATSRQLSNLQMVNLLIELGVDVNTKYAERLGENRYSGHHRPVYAAAHVLAVGENWWNISALESICKAGADLESTDSRGRTVLQCALSGDRSGFLGTSFWRDEALEVVLKHGAKINAISPYSGLTPLISALDTKRGLRVIQKLLDHGADMSLCPVPPIIVAVESGNCAVASAVIDAGADVNIVFHRPNDEGYFSNFKDEEAPLLAASLKGDRASLGTASPRKTREKMVVLLLERGANPWMELRNGKSTVFHEVCHNHGLIAPFIDAGIDLEVRDAEDQTPLMRACSTSAQSRVVKGDSTPSQLILAGANIHATDVNGSTPLLLATQAGLIKTVKLLLEKGANVSATNSEGLSPLYCALNGSSIKEDNRLDLINALLSAGAELQITGPNGDTPLHILAPTLMTLSPDGGVYFRDFDKSYLPAYQGLYEHFIAKGCDPNARDNAGNTPLFPYVKLTKLRCDYFAVAPPAESDVRRMFGYHDVFAVNNDGDTLLHAVAGREDDETSEPDGRWLFQELLARGLDPRKENNKGMSALDVAAACERQLILDLFAKEE